MKELQALGAVFKDIPRIDDGHGCGIDKPITLSEALPGIKVKPEATLRCPAALALARWMKESVIPAAAVAAKEQGRITTINQASSYICRLRNGAFTGKISEHARGNAIDIASFSFEKGEDIAVKPRREDFDPHRRLPAHGERLRLPLFFDRARPGKRRRARNALPHGCIAAKGRVSLLPLATFADFAHSVVRASRADVRLLDAGDLRCGALGFAISHGTNRTLIVELPAVGIALHEIGHALFRRRLLICRGAVHSERKDCGSGENMPSRAREERHQNSPSIYPLSFRNIRSADGDFGRPGIVMISPVMTTTKPAPAESRTSRTGTI